MHWGIIPKHFLRIRNSIFEICLHLINLNGTLDFLPFIDAEQRRGSIKRKPASRKWTTITRNTDHSTNLQLLKSAASTIFIQFFLFFSPTYIIRISIMMSNISTASDDSDVFYVEQSSSEPSPQRHNTPNILNSTEISEQHTTRMPSISSIASPEPRIFTTDDDSNEPTMLYGFGRQLPIVPPSLNDLNLQANPFNILATMAVVHQTQNTHDDNYSPQSPEPSELSSMSTPPMPNECQRIQKLGDIIYQYRR